MRDLKKSDIGIVIGTDTIRAAQSLNGQVLTGSVSLEEESPELTRALRQILASSPFQGRDVSLGFEGTSVLVESIVIPERQSHGLQALCEERLKGDPIFGDGRAVSGLRRCHQVSDSPLSNETLAILVAIQKTRFDDVIEACRELGLSVAGVEAAPLAAWRSWSGDGAQLRLVRSEEGDTILAGEDDALIFCSVVPRTRGAEGTILSLNRAMSLLGSDKISEIMASGMTETERETLSNAIGLSVRLLPDTEGDMAAIGLASEGVSLIDMTPPEERQIREKRRLRRVGRIMAGTAAVLVAMGGIVGFSGRLSLLEQKASMSAQVEQLEQTQSWLDGLNGELETVRTADHVVRTALPGHRMSTLLFHLMDAGTSITFEAIEVEDVPLLDGDAPRVLNITVHGLGETGVVIRDYVDALIETGAFVEVRLDSSERVLLAGSDETVRFRVTAEAETR